MAWEKINRLPKREADALFDKAKRVVENNAKIVQTVNIKLSTTETPISSDTFHDAQMAVKSFEKAVELMLRCLMMKPDLEPQ